MLGKTLYQRLLVLGTAAALAGCVSQNDYEALAARVKVVEGAKTSQGNRLANLESFEGVTGVVEAEKVMGKRYEAMRRGILRTKTEAESERLKNQENLQGFLDLRPIVEEHDGTLTNLTGRLSTVETGRSDDIERSSHSLHLYQAAWFNYKESLLEDYKKDIDGVRANTDLSPKQRLEEFGKKKAEYNARRKKLLDIQDKIRDTWERVTGDFQDAEVWRTFLTRAAEIYASEETIAQKFLRLDAQSLIYVSAFEGLHPSIFKPEEPGEDE